MRRLKLTTDKQTNRQTGKLTGQKQYAPYHSIRGHKNRQTILERRAKITNKVFICKHLYLSIA